MLPLLNREDTPFSSVNCGPMMMPLGAERITLSCYSEETERSGGDEESLIPQPRTAWSGTLLTRVIGIPRCTRDDKRFGLIFLHNNGFTPEG
jgi:hypothetical protein